MTATATATRAEGFDLARALAFIGMIFVNFRIAIAQDANATRWLDWLVMRLDGRASATFVVIAGVGLSLMARRARESGDRVGLAVVRNGLLRRSAILFGVGLVYWPLWPADILHYYGVYIAVGACLLAASGRRLGLLALGLIVLFALLLVLGVDYAAGWDFKALTYRGFWTPGGFVRNLFYNGFHPVVPWLAFLLVGIWLGRRDPCDARGWVRVLMGGVVVAALTEAGSRLLVRATTKSLGAEDAEAVFGTGSMPPMPLYMIAAMGTALGVIAASVLIAWRWPASRWLRPLVVTGQMALTLYVAHVVVGIVPLDVLGFWDGRRTVAFAASWAAVFCLAAVLGANLWRLRFTRGPLEMLLRRASRVRS